MWPFAPLSSATNLVFVDLSLTLSVCSTLRYGTPSNDQVHFTQQALHLGCRVAVPYYTHKAIKLARTRDVLTPFRLDTILGMRKSSKVSNSTSLLAPGVRPRFYLRIERQPATTTALVELRLKDREVAQYYVWQPTCPIPPTKDLVVWRKEYRELAHYYVWQPISLPRPTTDVVIWRLEDRELMVHPAFDMAVCEVEAGFFEEVEVKGVVDVEEGKKQESSRQTFTTIYTAIALLALGAVAESIFKSRRGGSPGQGEVEVVDLATDSAGPKARTLRRRRNRKAQKERATIAAGNHDQTTIETIAEITHTTSALAWLRTIATPSARRILLAVVDTTTTTPLSLGRRICIRSARIIAFALLFWTSGLFAYAVWVYVPMFVESVQQYLSSGRWIRPVYVVAFVCFPFVAGLGIVEAGRVGPMKIESVVGKLRKYVVEETQKISLIGHHVATITQTHTITAALLAEESTRPVVDFMRLYYIQTTYTLLVVAYTVRVFWLIISTWIIVEFAKEFIISGIFIIPHIFDIVALIPESKLATFRDIQLAKYSTILRVDIRLRKPTVTRTTTIPVSVVPVVCVVTGQDSGSASSSEATNKAPAGSSEAALGKSNGRRWVRKQVDAPQWKIIPYDTTVQKYVPPHRRPGSTTITPSTSITITPSTSTDQFAPPSPTPPPTL